MIIWVLTLSALIALSAIAGADPNVQVSFSWLMETLAHLGDTAAGVGTVWLAYEAIKLQPKGIAKLLASFGPPPGGKIAEDIGEKAWEDLNAPRALRKGLLTWLQDASGDDIQRLREYCGLCRALLGDAPPGTTALTMRPRGVGGEAPWVQYHPSERRLSQDQQCPLDMKLVECLKEHSVLRPTGIYPQGAMFAGMEVTVLQSLETWISVPRVVVTVRPIE